MAWSCVKTAGRVNLEKDCMAYRKSHEEELHVNRLELQVGFCAKAGRPDDRCTLCQRYDRMMREGEP